MNPMLSLNLWVFLNLRTQITDDVVIHIVLKEKYVL